MKISVIIPVYNAALCIERAVDSVLNQPEVNELILVDDGSKDDSYEKIKGLSEKYNEVKVYRHPSAENKGPAATRNLGIKMSTNNYIAFLDADDYFLPERFRIATSILESDHILDGVYESIESDPADNMKTKRIEVVKKGIKPEDLFVEMTPIGSAGIFSGNGLIVKKSLVEKAGYYNESMNFGEDVLLYLKCAFFGKLVQGRTDRPIGIFTRDGNNMTNNVVVRHYLIPVYENLLSDLKPYLNKEQRMAIIDRLIFSYLDFNHSSKGRIKAILPYFCQIFKLGLQFPSFLVSKQLWNALKSVKKLLFVREPKKGKLA